MKILYAIQGTGNGHLSRAREIVPLLQQHGDLDILVSGTQADVSLEQQIKYKFHGLSFVFGKKGGVDHLSTWRTMNMPLFIKDMKKIPLEDYDLIVNDFEPLTAWACRSRGIRSVGLSHQAAFKSIRVPKPRSIDWAELVLKYYAPVTDHIGFHFQRYDDFIYTPVIRQEIRSLVPTNQGHYTVYLPALDDAHILALLSHVDHVRWEVFSKHTRHSYQSGNVHISPINNTDFIKSISGCEGLFTGGGFEGPAEAMFLGKKLLVAPMKYQYEQQCNAYALKEMGLPVLWSSDRNWVPTIRAWVNNPQRYEIDFPDETAAVVSDMVKKYASK